MAMLAQIARMEVTVTRTDAEALLLENQLIKSLQPRYNVLLRDDKSYPVHPAHAARRGRGWPSIAGRGRSPGRYFGPYPERRRGARDAATRCTSCSSCAAARTACSATARGRACSTRSGAAARPAWAWSQARDYARCVRRAALFLDGTQRRAGRRTHHARWRRRARASISSKPRACAT